MTTNYWSLAGGDLAQDWSDTGAIAANHDWSGVASIVGYRGDDLTTGIGVDPQTLLLSTAAGETVNVIANQANPNTNTSGGIAEFQIADPVVALQGSGTADAPYLQLFLDATGRERVTLSFNARDVDGSADNAQQQIAVQYRVGATGGWTNLPAGYIVDATSAGAATQVTPVTVTLPDAVNGAAAVQVRIMTTNAAGSDEWVGIDDIRVTSQPLTTEPPANNGALGIADANVVEDDAGVSEISFVVTRSGGSAGAVSATWTATLPAGGADAADFAADQPLTGTISFADWQTSATVTLRVAGDTAFEQNETFTVALSAPTGGATLDARGTATGTITNDDAAPPAPQTNVFINEIHYNNVGTDAGEAIEIAGAAGTDLTGWTLALYRGAGTVYNSVTLSGVIADQANGIGVTSVSLPVNGLQNGNSGIALIDAAGRVVQFLSYDGAITATAGPALGLTSTDIGVSEAAGPPLGLSLQLVGEGSSGADFSWVANADDSFGALNAGQTIASPTGEGRLRIEDAQVGEGDEGTRLLAFTVYRTGGTANAASVDYAVALDGSADAADLAAGATLSGTVSFAAGDYSRQVVLPIAGDMLAERNETLTVRLGATTGDVVVEDAAATGTIVNDDPLTLAIGEIQGEGHRSAYAGQTVITSGIVTAVDTDRFYLQDAGGDGNARTSDAIVVFTGATRPTVAVGDAATVRGTVTEFVSNSGNLPLTEITAPTVTVTGQGNALPGAVLIGEGGLRLPTAAIDDDGLSSYDPATDGIDFWEALEGMRVTVDAPQVVGTTVGAETYVIASDGAGATGVNDRGGITVAPGDFNPERIQLFADTGVFGGYAPGHTVGDRLADVTGVVNYAAGDYSVVVTEAVTVREDVTLARETTSLRGDADHLSLATYNVENLDPSDGKYDLLASDIVYNLRAPDIIAVQEVQDADGAGTGAGLSGAATAQGLIDAIAAAGGGRYAYVEVAPSAPGTTGGEPGGNIRSGYFYNLDRVSYVAGSAELIDGPAYQGTRRPLAAQFEFNGHTLTTINVHFTSRLGSDPLYGANQPPEDAGDAARTAQAAGIKAYVEAELATDPSLNVAILGDWNGFAFEQAQTQLTEGGVFTNLNTLLSPEERYSYLFEGNAQQLDNVLVTGGLYGQAQYDSVHLNSQLTGERPTDHDPQVSLFFLPPPNFAPTDLVLSGDAVAENRAAGAVVGTLSATDSARDVLTYALVDDAGGRFVVDAATGVVTTTGAFDHEATPSFDLVTRVTDAGGLSAEARVTVSVTDVNEAPTAVGDAVAVDEDASTANLWSTLLGNDRDPDAGATLSIVGIDTADTLGSVIFDAGTQTLRYVADDDAFDALAPGATAADRFTYTVSDAAGLTSTATVDVTVTGIADGIRRTGTIFSETLTGTGGEDSLSGGLGGDTLYGRGGHDLLDGGLGNDRLYGEDGNDLLAGDLGNDLLIGGAGRDLLSGGFGSDTLEGGAGEDLLFGGMGNDTLQGGAGADLFRFGRVDGGDTILDFDVTEDRLVLEDGVAVSRSRVGDMDRDGIADLTISFTGGTSVTLLSVGGLGSVQFAGVGEQVNFAGLFGKPGDTLLPQATLDGLGYIAG